MSSINMSMDVGSGAVNLPAGLKETGKRVDFKPDEFVLAIETKGYRIAWSRATLCPCAPVNDQTQQPDPTCPICRGSGWFYFAPALATIDPLKVGELDGVQQRIVEDNAAVIHAIMTGIGTDWRAYDPIGSRMEGTMNATVRHENKLGYHDRITNLDSLITYAELIEVPAGNTMETRYPIKGINLLRSVDTVYTAPTDFTINSRGDVEWVTTPPVGATVTVHYQCHPTWLIVHHPHSIRLSPVRAKQKNPSTPMGEPKPLPIQAVAKYEWLPELAG